MSAECGLFCVGWRLWFWPALTKYWRLDRSFIPVVFVLFCIFLSVFSRNKSKWKYVLHYIGTKQWVCLMFLRIWKYLKNSEYILYIFEKMDQIVSLPSWVTFCLEYMNKYSQKKWVLWVFLYILIKLCHCLAGWLSAFTSLIMITGEQLTDGNVSTDINWTIELRWGPKVVFFIRNLRGKKDSNHHHVSQQNVTFPSETCIINSQLQMNILADNVQC